MYTNPGLSIVAPAQTTSRSSPPLSSSSQKLVSEGFGTGSASEVCRGISENSCRTFVSKEVTQRRRTQLRDAQRKHRQRQSETVATLEARVTSLEGQLQLADRDKKNLYNLAMKALYHCDVLMSKRESMKAQRRSPQSAETKCTSCMSRSGTQSRLESRFESMNEAWDSLGNGLEFGQQSAGLAASLPLDYQFAADLLSSQMHMDLSEITSFNFVEAPNRAGSTTINHPTASQPSTSENTPDSFSETIFRENMNGGNVTVDGQSQSGSFWLTDEELATLNCPQN